MSKAETLALVATAVDNASGPLRQVRRALDELAKSGNLGVHQKEIEKFRKELGGLAGSTEGFRRSGVQVTEFGRRFQELSARAAATSVGISRTFIPALATLGISTVTVTSALTGLTLATQRYADASREASKLSRETGFSPRFVQGIKGAAEELHVHGEQIGNILQDISGKFQRFTLPGGGELGKNMALNPAFRSTFAEMRQIMADQSKPLDERNAQSLGVLIDRINELKKTNPDTRVREMIKDIGLDPALVDLASKNWKTIQERMDAYIKKVGELDPAKAKAFAEANRELSRSFEALQNSVGAELITRLTEITAAIAGFIDANKGDLSTGIRREFEGIEKAVTSVISAFEKVNAAIPDWIKNPPQEKEGEGRWDFFKRRWGLDAGDQKRRPQLPAEPSTVPSEVLEQMNAAEALPEVKVTPPANPKYRAPFSPRSGQQLPKADVNAEAQRFIDGPAGYGPYSPNTGGLDSFMADSPMSGNVEDRRGYVGTDESQKSALAANTERLAELNRYLDELLHGRPGTSAAQFFAGSGGVGGGSAPGGMGGLPGLPSGGRGAPGAGGLFERLGGPMPGGKTPDGVFGGGSDTLPAPQGAPFNRFTPGAPTFGPPPGKFSPGSSIEKPAGVGPGSAIPPAGGDVRLDESHGFQGRGALAGRQTEPWLVDTVREATKALPPGYSAKVISSLDSRSTGTPWHPSGRAIDVSILDDKGKAVPNVGHPPGSPAYQTYEKMALAARQYAEKQYPDQKFTWGGHFNSGTPLDLMHFQSGGTSARNFTKEQLATPVLPQGDARLAQGQPSWPRTLPPGAQGNQVANLPTRPAVPDNLPADALNPNATQLPGGTNALAADRAKFAEELRNNPAVRDRFMSSVQAEVGSQPKAQQMYIESVMNRASADRKSLEQTINDPIYYPNATKRQLGGATDAMREHYGPKFDSALAGSNEANLATGNASLGVNRNYPTLASAQGERFVLEQYKRHEAWQKNMQKSIAEQRQATMLKTNPSSTLPDQSGLYSGNKLAGALPPKDEDDDEAEAGGFSKPGQFSKAGGYTPIPGELSAKSQQAQKFSHEVTGRAAVDVNVTAPRGTKAKASADGMFKNVSLNRTMAGEAAPATQHASEGEE